MHVTFFVRIDDNFYGLKKFNPTNDIMILTNIRKLNMDPGDLMRIFSEAQDRIFV